MARGKRDFDVVGDELKDGQAHTLGEIGSLPPIEQVTENDFVKVAELEAFMNEKLTIVVHDTDKEGELEVICPSVNGVNQPIIRNVKSKVKRKYVEALARSLVTKHVQRLKDLNDPSSLVMQGKSVQSYPFTVIDDPNPNGRPWLEAIVRSAVADAAR